MRRLTMLALGFLGIVLMMNGCSDDGDVVTGKIGWTIGDRPDGTAAILHTDNSGRSWEEQGDPALWTGMGANDISAVDEWTAWAAVGNEQGGAILHTSNGGFTWNVQSFPEGVNEDVKGIKGLSRDVAWAVTINGTVLKTFDGGKTWTVIPHENITIKQVNRIDAKDEDIWIADYGNLTGMIHSSDSGQTWRQEPLPEDPDVPETRPMGVSIVSSQIAWAAIKTYPMLYRTTDGGEIWHEYYPEGTGANDIDDICAPNADMVWAVQNIGGVSGGIIIRGRLINGEVITETTDPMNNKYQYEGVTCFDEKTVWVVGFKGYDVDKGLPEGAILHTSDGTTWTSQLLPVNDVALWKVSFVGAHR